MERSPTAVTPVVMLVCTISPGLKALCGLRVMSPPLTLKVSVNQPLCMACTAKVRLVTVVLSIFRS